jgi:hypothetical protein
MMDGGERGVDMGESAQFVRNSKSFRRKRHG